MVAMAILLLFSELLEEDMYKVKKIDQFEFTRNIVLASTDGTEITVFDDSDLLGNNDFDFIKVGQSYNFKIGILGDVCKIGKEFIVGENQKIGEVVFRCLLDSKNNVFYLEPDNQAISDDEIGSKIKVDVERYDILQVNETVHSGYV